MNRKIFCLVSVFLLSAMLVLSLGYVQAQTPIPVFNFSFEDPVLSPGEFTIFFPPPGWSPLFGAGGVFYPLVGTHVIAPVPDGNQVAYLGNVASPGSIAQDFGGAEVGAVYQLDVFVGSRLEGYPANYLIEFLAGTTLVTASDTINPGTGEFFLVSLTAMATESGPVRVRLSETGTGQSMFDDVHVQINPGSP